MERGGPADWLIRGGTVVTPDGSREADVVIHEGRIVSVSRDPDVEARETVDAGGCLVLPGAVDPHVHLSLPTATGVSADSFSTGTRAAACGGVTGLLDFALYETGCPLAERLERRRRAAEGRIFVDCGFHVELGRADVHRLGEIRACVARGARSFKVYMAFDDPEVRVGREEIRRFAEALADAGGILVVHAEDGAGVERNLRDRRSRGRLSPREHGAARPAELEAGAIDELLEVGRTTGVEIYVVHVSSAMGLERIREWKARGVKVRAETCPQYLLLTDELYGGPDGVQYLANPPLRRREDLEALWAGVEDGTIDTIATDHCPFARSDKMRYRDDFSRAPKGLPGVETRLPLVYSEGVGKRGISLERVTELLSTNPAEVFGLAPAKGRIAPGSDADVVVLDPAREAVVSAGALHMNTDFNPFEGWTVRGWPSRVFARGECVYREGELLGEEGRGRFLHQRGA